MSDQRIRDNKVKAEEMARAFKLYETLRRSTYIANGVQTAQNVLAAYSDLANITN